MPELNAVTATVERPTGHGTTRPDVLLVSAPTPDTGPRTRRGAAVLTVMSVAAVLVGTAIGVETVRSLGAAVFFLFGIGSAATAVLRRVSTPGFVLLSVASSFTITLLVGFAMAETGQWHPTAAFAVLAVVAMGLHAKALVRPTDATPAPAVTIGRLRDAAPALLPSVAGLVLLGTTALVRSGSHAGFGGAFARLGVPWLVGLAFVVIGVASAATPRARWAAGFTVVVLAVALALTPALLYEYPTVTSAARHVGVAEVIGRLGGVDRAQGIYHRWPGLFAGSDLIWSVGGVSNPLSWARWAAVLINPVAALAVHNLARRIVGADGYGLWLAAAVFAVVNILGNAYFSPQSVCFVLALVVFALAIPTPDTETGRGRTLRLAALTITGVAITVTHQLSPYLILPALFVLIAFRLVRPWHLLLLVGVPAITWALINYSALGQFIDLGALGRAGSNAAPPDHGGTLGYRGLTQWAIYAPMALFLVVGAAATVVALRHRDRLRWALLACAASPALLFAGNNYGNEALFRAALFSLPWLVILLSTSRWTPRLAVPIAAVALLVGAAVFSVGTYGLDWYRVIRPGTVDAIRHIEATAARGSVVLTAGSGNAIPGRLTERSPDVQYIARDTLHALPRTVGYDATRDVADLTRAFVRSGSAAPRYVLVTTSTGAYDDLYGIQPYRDFVRMRAAFAASPLWDVDYRSPSATVYKLDVTAYRVAVEGAG